MNNMPGLIHIHGQQFPHDDVLIVGNREGLLRLRNAIDMAINGTMNDVEVMTQDGECYYLYVRMNDNNWQNDLMRKL